MSLMVSYLRTFLSVILFVFQCCSPLLKLCPLVYCGEMVRIRFIIVEFGHPLYTAKTIETSISETELLPKPILNLTMYISCLGGSLLSLCL